MTQLTSRERMLRAIDLQQVDHIPCCFMSFAALRNRLQGDRYRVAQAELDTGMDAMLFIPTAPRPARPEHPDLRGLPVRFDARVRTSSRRDSSAGGPDVLHRSYLTPSGTLTVSVRLTEDWPHGDCVPFVDDYQVPRAVKPLVSHPGDLDALQYLLAPPHERDLAAFAAEAERAAAFARDRGILLAGGWGVGMDMANWLCGVQNLIFLQMEHPRFVADLLQLIHEWNVQRMEVVLSAPVDLYIRRAWYEGCDFVTPRFFRQAVLPRLKAEVELAHARGARFGYICSSGLQPMLDLFLEAGIDVLIGVDPVQGTYTDLPLLKQKLDGKMCIWGGVSGAMTVERGTPHEVRAAVREAVESLGPTGFILSPVDNITVDEPQTWSNIEVFVDEWKRR